MLTSAKKAHILVQNQAWAFKVLSSVAVCMCIVCARDLCTNPVSIRPCLLFCHSLQGRLGNVKSQEEPWGQLESHGPNLRKQLFGLETLSCALCDGQVAAQLPQPLHRIVFTWQICFSGR